MSNDDRERPTDPISHAAPLDSDAPPMPTMPPAAHLPSTGPNPSFAEDMLRDLLATAKRLEDHYQTLLDPKGLLTQQTAQIGHMIDANYRLVHGEVVSIGKQLEALGERVKTHDIRLESGEERFERIDLDLAAMRAQLDRLESELSKLKEGRSGQGKETAPTTEREALRDP